MAADRRALVALWVEPRRVTEDIDVIGMGGTQDERFALMNLAIELGLPIEAVNSAADFFVRRIPGGRDDIELLHAGARSMIYRPTPTLFVIPSSGAGTASPGRTGPSGTSQPKPGQVAVLQEIR